MEGGGIKDLYPLKPGEELENNSKKLKDGCDYMFRD